MTIISIAHELGCNKAESETFASLARFPDGITVLELSRELNLPRPTVYSHLERLMEIGIAKKGIRENTSLLYPESADILQQILDEKIATLKRSRETIGSSFAQVKAVGRFKPKFFVYEGKHAYSQVWRDILRTKEEAYWIWPIKDMLQTMSTDKLKEFHQERIKKGIWMNVLWPEKSKLNIATSPFLMSADEKESLRRVKILPKGFDQDTGYGIYGNKVAFISSGSENYAFVIESKELSQTLRKQFDFFWKLSRNYQ